MSAESGEYFFESELSQSKDDSFFRSSSVNCPLNTIDPFSESTDLSKSDCAKVELAIKISNINIVDFISSFRKVGKDRR